MQLLPLTLRRALAGLPLLAALATACSSDPVTPDTTDYAAQDEATLKQYIADQKITNAQRQPSGLYFVPDSVNASLPLLKAGQKVSVLYTGQLLNGQVFDATSKRGNQPYVFTLGAGQVITGWDLGVALMHKGDKARLLIPSGLAYGAGYGAIPPNTPLLFTIKVVDAQ